MSRIFCSLCKQQICKYEMDFNSTGAVEIEVDIVGIKETKFNDCFFAGQETIEREKTHSLERLSICNDCAKKIAIKLIEKSI